MKFSIILPTFKREHSLLNTVSTIKAQSYNLWELIIIDNFGSDYQFDDERIHYFVHNQVYSASWARNKGINYATGDIICFFDDDDIMLPHYLQVFYDLFSNNPQAKMIVCKIDANKDLKTMQFATPCCAIKSNYVTQHWDNKNYLQDQRYFRSIIKANRWRTNIDIIFSSSVVACVGHSNKGGLRDQDGNL